MKWIFPEQKDTPLLDWLYSSRKIQDRERFLTSTLADLHDPFALHDMKKCAKAIAEAIKNKKKIFIHGDFDVDGITATSIMWRFLHYECKADVLPYIPDRFTEGYGLSEDSINNIISQGGNLIITVDCGVKDIELVNKYANKIDFIITDHHSIRETKEGSPTESDKLLPGSKEVGNYLISSKALAVVHPTLPSYPFKEICGGVVAWKVCSALNEYLKLEIDMAKYLDLAALATVCDIMPLVDENRIIVREGLNRMRVTENIGLKALFNSANLKSSNVAAYHLGFVLGPRLNAAGRLEKAMDAVRLLTTESRAFADQLASKLEALNIERRSLTGKYLEIAENIIEAGDKNNKIYVVVGDEWPEGILGLIAGRLTDKYRRPVIIGSRKGDMIKASARSIPEFNVTSALGMADKYLLRYGGHAQAAGLSFSDSGLTEITKILTDFANNEIADIALERVLQIEGLLNMEDLNMDLVKELSLLEPFGYMNPQPVIALRSIGISNFATMGSKKEHIKLNFPNSIFEAVGFGQSQKFNELLDGRSANSSTLLDLAGHLEVNKWNGNEKISLKLVDFRVSE